LTEQESQALIDESALGTVCGLHIDGEGRVSPSSLNRRLVGPTSEDEEIAESIVGEEGEEE